MECLPKNHKNFTKDSDKSTHYPYSPSKKGVIRLGVSISLALWTFITLDPLERAIALPKATPIPHPTLSAQDQISGQDRNLKEYIRDSISCPTDITALVPLIVRDLPSYANRVSTRAQVSERSFNPRGIVIAAAQAEEDRAVSALLNTSINPSIASTNTPSTLEQELELSLEQMLDTHQLIPFFFTTLERQYVGDHAVRLQHYHWAFLSQTTQKEESQWHLAFMFSRLGDYPAEQPAAPPRESRQGSIGQALQLWLRDCNAGSIAGQNTHAN
ncbi:MAG: hypothetical protein AAGD25_20835 [Cyanobacteria bacterium P01_F01_bin.150]